MGHVCLHTGGRTYSLQFARHHGEAYARRNHYIVSTDFNLARHSSPSFGSQHLCSASSQQCEVDWKSRDCPLRVIPRADKLLFAFTAPLGLVNPMACIHVSFGIDIIKPASLAEPSGAVLFCSDQDKSHCIQKGDCANADPYRR